MLKLVTEEEKQQAELIFYPNKTVMEVWQLQYLINNLHPNTKIIVEGRLLLQNREDLMCE